VGLRVAIQDRRRFVREGLAEVLRIEPDLDIVGTADDAAALVQLCRAQRLDAVVLELTPGEWDAPRLAAALRRQQRALRVVGTYVRLGHEEAQRVYRAGVRSAVPESAGADGVVAALRTRDPSPVVIDLVERRPARDRATLTAREVEVLTLIARGLTVAEVAVQLGVSPKTVENRKQNIFGKLGVQNQAHAVSVALRTGVLQPELFVAGS
jgi:DNA-binding NarL/FixJ family response regulator